MTSSSVQAIASRKTYFTAASTGEVQAGNLVWVDSGNGTSHLVAAPAPVFTAYLTNEPVRDARDDETAGA